MARPNQAEIVPDGLEDKVGDWVGEFVDQWYLAGIATLSVLPVPNLTEEEDADIARRAWIGSLAGNIVWAFAVFTPAGLAAEAMLTSLIGIAIAAASSYPGGRNQPLTSPESAKGLILDKLALACEPLETLLRKRVPELALRVSLFEIKRPFSEQDKKVQEAKAWLWRQYFHVPYEHHRKALKDMMLTAIEGALRGFEKDYRVWKKQIDHCVARQWRQSANRGDPSKKVQKACIDANKFTYVPSFRGVSPELDKAAAAYAAKYTRELLHGLIWSYLDRQHEKKSVEDYGAIEKVGHIRTQPLYK